jgi:predicted small secreted protein
MTRKLVLMLLLTGLLLAGCQTMSSERAGSGAGKWHSLFDGKSLDGWKASENKDTFSVRDGMIVVHGPRSHLFYTGPVNNANFKNFEFKADVMTTEGSNSGIYFHTEYQETGWPSKGFECQVNTTHSDRKKTGGLYAIQDVIDDAPSTDDEWFHYYIRVEDNHVIIQIDGKTTMAWTQPEDWKRSGRMIGEGTIALQGHDPKSLVYYKNIMVRVPPAPMD